jgi:hypothetical protein
MIDLFIGFPVVIDAVARGQAKYTHNAPPSPDCAGEGQQQFNRPTCQLIQLQVVRQRGQEPLDTDTEDPNHYRAAQ